MWFRDPFPAFTIWRSCLCAFNRDDDLSPFASCCLQNLNIIRTNVVASVLREAISSLAGIFYQGVSSTLTGDCFGLGLDTAEVHRLLDHQPSQRHC